LYILLYTWGLLRTCGDYWRLVDITGDYCGFMGILGDFGVSIGISLDHLGLLGMTLDCFVPIGNCWGIPEINRGYWGLLRVAWD
jgi:hypothetical protein